MRLKKKTRCAEKIKETIRSHTEDDGWIPVEKKLPEEGQEVWISTKTNRVRRGMYTRKYGYEMSEGFICSDGFMWMNTALAWMPYYAPEPYRSKED